MCEKVDEFWGTYNLQEHGRNGKDQWTRGWCCWESGTLHTLGGAAGAGLGFGIPELGMATGRVFSGTRPAPPRP